MTINELYEYAKKKLHNLDVNCLKYEVRLIIETYLGMNEVEIILNRNKEIEPEKLDLLIEAIDLRSQGNPLQYILGTWKFMDIDLTVGPGVLIPREDTQVLVDIVVPKFKSSKKIRAIDLCSGTGCIALAMEKIFRNKLEMYAVELSNEAYIYLCKNIKTPESKIKTINGNIFVVHKKFGDNYFDCVVSNPPYIKSKEIGFLQKEVLHEPRMALDGGSDGLDFYRDICKLWIPKIKPGGFLAFEIGIGQFEDVKNIMIDSGLKSVNFKRDINGIERAVIGTKTQS